MRIAESFCKMRLSEYCSAQDIDRAIAVTVESFIGSQKVSAKKALARAFAKYVMLFVSTYISVLTTFPGTHFPGPSHSPSAVLASLNPTRMCPELHPQRGKHFQVKVAVSFE